MHGTLLLIRTPLCVRTRVRWVLLTVGFIARMGITYKDMDNTTMERVKNSAKKRQNE